MSPQSESAALNGLSQAPGWEVLSFRTTTSNNLSKTTFKRKTKQTPLQCICNASACISQPLESVMVTYGHLCSTMVTQSLSQNSQVAKAYKACPALRTLRSPRLWNQVSSSRTPALNEVFYTLQILRQPLQISSNKCIHSSPHEVCEKAFYLRDIGGRDLPLDPLIGLQCSVDDR